MLLKIFAIFIALVASIACCSGTVVVSDSVTTAAGKVSYSMDYSTGIGFLTHAPVETIVANNNYISVAVEGASIAGALSINGALDAQAANGAKASAEAIIKGPGASVSNYNLYGYVVPDLAWAGQYVDSMRGTYFWLSTDGEATNSKWAGSVAFSNQADSPVFTVNKFYQDAMATNRWAMADIYDGRVDVNSPNDPNNWIDIYTGWKFWADAGVNSWTYGDNFIDIQSTSSAYVDPNMNYANLDYRSEGTPGIYSYWYINYPLHINDRRTVYY